MQEKKKSSSTASIIEKLKASVPIFDSDEEGTPEEELDEAPLSSAPGTPRLNQASAKKFMKGFKQ